MSLIKFQTAYILTFQPPPEVTVSKIYLTDRSKANQNNNYFHCHKDIPQVTKRNQQVKDESIERIQSSETESVQRHKGVKKNKKKKKNNESTDKLLKE